MYGRKSIQIRQTCRKGKSSAVYWTVGIKKRNWRKKEMKDGGKHLAYRTGLVKRKMDTNKATHAILFLLYKKLYSKTGWPEMLDLALGEPRYNWHFLIQKICVCSLLSFSIYESPIIVLRTNWYCSSSEYAMQVSPTNLAVDLSLRPQSNQQDNVIPDLKQCSKKILAWVLKHSTEIERIL